MCILDAILSTLACFIPRTAISSKAHSKIRSLFIIHTNANSVANLIQHSGNFFGLKSTALVQNYTFYLYQPLFNQKNITLIFHNDIHGLIIAFADSSQMHIQ